MPADLKHRLPTVLLGVTLLLAGCGRTVAVQPPTDVLPAVVRACQQLQEVLPESLTAGRSWPVEPASPLTAAWATPAVVLRCGVPEPRGLSPASQLVTIDGVDWYAEELTRGVRFTTVGRTANVEVEVPGAYAPAAQTLAEFANPITRSLPPDVTQ